MPPTYPNTSAFIATPPVPALLAFQAALRPQARAAERLLRATLLCRGWSEKQLCAFRLTVNHLATRAGHDLHPVLPDLAKLTKTDCDLKLTGCDAAQTHRFLSPVFDPSLPTSIPKVSPFDTPTEHETPQRNGRPFFQMEVRFHAAA
jgi:hypothetical protein